ncbi:general negative regulator of transcription subunit 5 [Ascosphaera pollenicola]|nr:general negative regulator of transcription subunit 5 [Ascosphaera pollenicola]
MASRKTQQEIEKTFKKVGEGIASFEGIYEKIRTTQNLTQRDKLEDQLKREIKKLQRFRDQIKTWAAGNEVKDKSPLLEQRRAIETCMEQFKAVEKEMKTKAYSKEGLSAAARLDPKDKEKAEMCDFLSQTVDILQQKVEAFEAEEEQIHASLKKGKKDTQKANRLADISRISERHCWHVGRLELLLRMLQNGNIETRQIADIKDSIAYFAEDGHDPDFYGEDESIYEDLNLDEEEAAFGMSLDNDRVSSQDTQSLQDAEDDRVPAPTPITRHPKKDPHAHITRRPSTQSKSPLPVLSTLHMNPQAPATVPVKPAPVPTRPGETLKYASAAAAAAASDRNGVGIAPLPPPPGAAPSPATTSAHPSPAVSQAAPVSKLPSTVSTHPSPQVAQVQPVQRTVEEPGESAEVEKAPVPTAAQSTTTSGAAVPATAIATATTAAPTSPPPPPSPPHPSSQSKGKKVLAKREEPPVPQPQPQPQQPGQPQAAAVKEEEEPVYHIPPTLQDLVESYETMKSRAANKPQSRFSEKLAAAQSVDGASQPHDASTAASVSFQRLLAASHQSCPEFSDSEKPMHYKPIFPYDTPAHYPQEPLPLFRDPRLFDGRLETDTLFYIFYYQQGTYYQYLAARSLKNQSWRFHKQYQTWFQRHEEPKIITEEYEQGTYRFFDYESTWMNRRKADFQFMYKFLEDDL